MQKWKPRQSSTRTTKPKLRLALTQGGVPDLNRTHDLARRLLRRRAGHDYYF